MWQRYSFYDLRVVGHYLGELLLFTAAMMLIPFAIGIVLGEYEPARRYLIAIGITLCVGALLSMMRIGPGKLTRHQGITITSLAWLVIGVMAAIPFMLASSHYSSSLDAIFDTVSMVTTTGVSLAADVDHFSYADAMWRFLLNYAGGLGLIVVAMSLGLFSGGAVHSSLYESEGNTEHVLPNVLQTTKFILKFMLAILFVSAFVLFFILMHLGIAPIRAAFQGLCLAISAIATAGPTPQSSGVIVYHSAFIEFVIMAIMIIGSINFSLQREVFFGRVKMFFQDIEIRTGVLWIAGTLVIFICALAGSDSMNNFPVLIRTGLFTFVAATTTCGMGIATGNQLTTLFPSGAFLVITMLMAVGSSSTSTAGGIKLRRIAIIAKSSFETLKSIASPDSARISTQYFHLERHHLNAVEVKESMTVCIFFIMVFIVGALVAVAYGYDAVYALSESVAMATNAGISVGIASTSAPTLLKIVYLIEMWAGRLELVTFFAVAIKIFTSAKSRIPLKDRDR